ncbi:copper resistance protein CopC [Streptomyces hoynatensis]|uniref:Copper resistance protein CopC n=1 Tax=Streptomyces hoynatensis TaxID=1141874 RepID=A0A3A9YRZ0_9ACTN|nr:copper resistance protein CopC [Streptomyces hoynatensis]RKN38016.1 hypothetical protein D7294_25860 [Streptomyces hoynatensis]
MTTLRRSLAALLLGAVAALAALLVTAAPAAAHATLAGSTPGDGEVVATAPEQVTLTFSEHVSVAEGGIRVLGPEGEAADTGELGGEGAERSVALRPGLPEGTYTVAWQVVSADSHPISGAFTFSIGAPSATTVDASSVAASGDDGAVGLLYDIARYAAYAGFVLLAGPCVFVLCCWPGAAGRQAVQRVTLTGWTAATAATLALLLLRTPYTGSGDLADAFDLDGLRDVVGTKEGTALVTRLLILAASGAFLALLHGSWARLRTRVAAHGAGRATRDRAGADDARDEVRDEVRGGEPDDARDEERGGEPGTGSDDAPDDVPAEADGEEPDDEADADRLRDYTFGLALGGTVLAVGIAATWAMAEHASTGRQTALAIPADIVHLLSVATWLGGLVTLLSLLHGAPATPPAAAVRRFSGLALGSVAALAATGLYQSWRQVGLSWSALTGTSYGKLLILKVALVAGVLAVAFFSRRLTARLADPAATTGTGEAGTPEAGTPEAEHAPGRRPEPAAVAAAERDPGAGQGPRPVDAQRARQLARQRDAALRARRQKARNAEPARAALRRSVLAEAAVAAVVLAVTTGLTNTTPAHTAAAAENAGPSGSHRGAHGEGHEAGQEPPTLEIPYDTGGPGGQGTAHVEFSSAGTGENTLHVSLTDPAGQVTEVAEIRVALSLPAEDLGPLRYQAQRVDAGHWAVTGVQLPRPGEWELDLTVRSSDIDEVTETAEFTLE